MSTQSGESSNSLEGSGKVGNLGGTNESSIVNNKNQLNLQN